MPVTRPTVLGSEFRTLDCVWNIWLDDVQGPYSYFTNDYPGELFAQPLARRGWVTAYSLQSTRSPAVPIFRNELGRYSNRAGEESRLLIRGESVALPGQSRLVVPIQTGRGTSGAFDAVELDGYVWAVPMPQDTPNGYNSRDFTVTGSNGRIDRIYLATRGGAYPVRWQTTIPSAGIDRDWLAGGDGDWGAGISGAEFWWENSGATRFIHNPTIFGNISKNHSQPNPNADLNIRMPSPVVEVEIGPSPISALRIRSRNVPLEWARLDDGGDGVGPSWDHGGDDYHPTIWDRCQQELQLEVNWMGREGVTLLQFRGYAPFSVPLCELIAIGHSVTGTDLFDKLYFYDVASDTLTDMAWNWAAEGTAKYENTTVEFRSTTGLGTSSGPSKTPSGYAACLMRCTGTQFGTNDDFTVGIYCRFEHRTLNLANKLLAMQSGIKGMLISAKHGFLPPGYTNQLGQSLVTQTEGTSRNPGWLGYQYWMVVDTFPNVLAKIRQLYLDGYGDSKWLT